MPKNQIKTEAAEPYSEQTSLGGPIPKIGSPGVMPCRLQLSSKALAAAGMKPRDQVQLIAEEGQIIIKKIGEPDPGYPILQPKERPELDAFLVDMKRKSKGPEWEDELEGDEEESEAGEAAGLSEEQRSQEEL